MQPTDEGNTVCEAKDEGILISVFTDRLMLPSEPAGAHKTAVPAGQRLLTDIKAKSQQVVKHGGQMWLCALGQRPPRSYWKNNSRPSKEVRDADQRSHIRFLSALLLGDSRVFVTAQQHDEGFLNRGQQDRKIQKVWSGRRRGRECVSVLQGPHVSHALDSK